MQFQYCQNKLAIPQLWKDNIKNFARNSCNLFIQDHHIIMHHRTINLEELNSKEFCKIQSSLKYEKFSPVYHKKRFDNYHFDCGIPYTATYNTIEKFGSSSVNFLMFYIFIKSYINSELSLVLNVASIIHMIEYHCIYFMNIFVYKIYGTNLNLARKIDLLVLTPLNVIFSFVDIQDQIYLLFNHLLLMSKYNIYNSSINNNLHFPNLKCVNSAKDVSKSQYEITISIKREKC